MNPTNESTSPRGDDDAERVVRETAAACWRQFVASVRAERPMSLPNLVRLYRRRVARFDPAVGAAALVASGAALLTNAYLRQQPVRRQSRLVLRE